MCRAFFVCFFVGICMLLFTFCGFLFGFGGLSLVNFTRDFFVFGRSITVGLLRYKLGTRAFRSDSAES